MVPFRGFVERRRRENWNMKDGMKDIGGRRVRRKRDGIYGRPRIPPRLGHRRRHYLRGTTVRRRGGVLPGAEIIGSGGTTTKADGRKKKNRIESWNMIIVIYLSNSVQEITFLPGKRYSSLFFSGARSSIFVLCNNLYNLYNSFVS